MNVICLLGRLTADPELKRTTSGASVVSFNLAVDRRVPDAEHSCDFLPCVAFNKTAEFVAHNFTKGQRIGANGRLQAKNYTDKNGNKRTSYDVIVDCVYFADHKEKPRQEYPEEVEYL